MGDGMSPTREPARASMIDGLIPFRRVVWALEVNEGGVIKPALTAKARRLRNTWNLGTEKPGRKRQHADALTGLARVCVESSCENPVFRDPGKRRCRFLDVMCGMGMIAPPWMRMKSIGL